MNRNHILLGIVVLALVALGVFAWYTLSGNSGGTLPVVADATGAIPSGYDRTLGSPNAPIKIIEYAAPMCPICASFNANEFPKLKAEYIDTGKVFYTFRVFPIGNPDFGAEGLARCLPAAQYFSFIDFLYRNQDKWDPDGHDIPDVRGALLHMAAVFGMDKSQANRCIDDKAAQARINKVAQDAAARYGVSGTPTFVVDNQVTYSGEWPWELLKPELDTKLGK